MITPHPATITTIITTQLPSHTPPTSSRKTNPLNLKPFNHPPNPKPSQAKSSPTQSAARSSKPTNEPKKTSQSRSKPTDQNIQPTHQNLKHHQPDQYPQINTHQNPPSTQSIPHRSIPIKTHTSHPWGLHYDVISRSRVLEVYIIGCDGAVLVVTNS